jgi:hypothetical protein
VNHSPPPGVIGYGIFTAAGVRHSVVLDRSTAETNAARMGGYFWPLVCGRRIEDKSQLPKGQT